MEVSFYIELIALRIIISVIGVLGNMILIISIFQMTRLKTFEVILLGLAAVNLEMIVIVNIYDIMLIRYSYRIGVWACRSLKFLTVFGEIGSILFTVVISIYRYQKLRDVHTRVNLPIFMDNMRSAIGISAFCCILALLFGVPTFLIDLNDGNGNSSQPGCPADFFHCTLTNCPVRNRTYKYSFILVCILLPLLIVTLTSTMIFRILIVQQRVVRARHETSVVTSTSQPQRPKKSGLQRSTVAILAAMALFQVDWSIYLILHLACDPYRFPSWSEVEFLITTFYTAISPYVYGLGNNLFNIKRIIS
ncbi:melatonin receptor type 1B-B-like [Xyrauchen texanus]|uniref:melatonin receptor type 1B-B-like n=1 Tax=Xyrauchen texanus TaxID=154827 RepID=UPI002242493D|nr:melatonin receptor type 1B-B-like [Xyrauchen texanus]